MARKLSITKAVYCVERKQLATMNFDNDQPDTKHFESLVPALRVS